MTYKIVPMELSFRQGIFDKEGKPSALIQTEPGAKSVYMASRNAFAVATGPMMTIPLFKLSHLEQDAIEHEWLEKSDVVKMKMVDGDFKDYVGYFRQPIASPPGSKYKSQWVELEKNEAFWNEVFVGRTIVAIEFDDNPRKRNAKSRLHYLVLDSGERVHISEKGIISVIDTTAPAAGDEEEADI